MNVYKPYPWILLLAGLLGCATKPVTTAYSFSRLSPQEYLTGATNWMQTSAEARALQYQAFNIARTKLDQDLKVKSKNKRAIIVDADETVIDNSAYQADNILKGQVYTSENWKAWVDLSKVRAVPGAVEFCNMSNPKGRPLSTSPTAKKKNMMPLIKIWRIWDFPSVKSSWWCEKKIAAKKVAETLLPRIIMLSCC